MKKRKVLLNVRIDAELLEKLKNLATEQNRTLSNLVETELKKATMATNLKTL